MMTAWVNRDRTPAPFLEVPFRFQRHVVRLIRHGVREPLQPPDNGDVRYKNLLDRATTQAKIGLWGVRPRHEHPDMDGRRL